MSIQYRASAHPTTGVGGIDDVTAGDTSLTISPTTGDVVASLNTANANTWTADQTFTDNTKVTLGTGGDADIYYDGTSLRINCRVVGSGDFVVSSNIVPSVDSTYDIGNSSRDYSGIYSDTYSTAAYWTFGVAGVDGSFGAAMGANVTVTKGLVTSL